MSESSESTSRSDDEAINTAKAALLLAGGTFDANTESTVRRVLDYAAEAGISLATAVDVYLKHLAENMRFQADMLETMGTEKARKITMEEVESIFVQDGFEGKVKIRAEILETMGTDEARKIIMDEAEALFVQDGIEE